MNRMESAASPGLRIAAFVQNTTTIRIRFWWLIIMALVLHQAPFLLLAPSSLVELKKALMVLAYILLLFALGHNLRLWSARILGFGAALNFAAIVANSGLMPVSAEARLQAGMTDLGQSAFGTVLPEGTGILLPVNATNLWFLSDIIPVPGIGAVFSIGDVLIAVAFLVFIVELVFHIRTRAAASGRGSLGEHSEADPAKDKTVAERAH